MKHADPHLLTKFWATKAKMALFRSINGIERAIQSTLGFVTMGKAANLALATRNAVTDLF